MGMIHHPMDNLVAKLRNILQVGFDMTDFNMI